MSCLCPQCLHEYHPKQAPCSDACCPAVGDPSSVDANPTHDRPALPIATTEERPATMSEMVAIVFKLVRQIQKSDPENAVAAGAMSYIKRKDLTPSPFRNSQT